VGVYEDIDVDVSKLGYRPCVGIMVLNGDGLVWVGRRAEAREAAEGDGAWWQMPQGGIGEHEDPASAALRELFEETGMRRVEIIAELPGWHCYDLPPHLQGKVWGGQYRGQSQKWFAARYFGSDEDIDIGPRNGQDVEFDAWKWVPISELMALVVAFKRDVYAEVVRAFSPLAVANETPPAADTIIKT